MTIIKGIIASIVVIVKGILLILEMIIKLPIWLIGEIASDIRLKKEKEEETPADGRKTYHWEPAISSPRKYPVEVFKADFILDQEPNKEGNVRVRSYFGPDFQCGGMGIEKSTAFDEDYRVVLPRYIEALWISYAENQVYYLYEELPYDEIERLFGEGYDFYEDRNSEPKKVNFDVINLCFLPEGKVALYLNGTRRTILLDWSAQGKATDEFNDVICEEHEIIPPFDEYADRMLKENPHIEVEREIPMGEVLDKYFEKYTYEIRFEFEKESTPFVWAKEEYANGEMLCSRNRTKVTSIQRPARLKYYELSWYAGGYEYFGELWFQEEEMLHLFDEAYGEDRMQESVLLIAYSEENESFEVTLQVGGKKYAFEKTEVWISKIPEALETDGKAQRERVFKNFEGDNKNAFRVK